MDKIAALSKPTKLMLGGGVLLLIDLFLTWQSVRLDFGPGTQVTQGQDGWDFWGLLIALAILALIVIVVVRETDSELLLDRRWDAAPLVLGGLALVMVVVKNLRDADSTWASYLGIALAAVVVVGAFLDWSRNRLEDSTIALQPRPAGPYEASAATRERSTDEPQPKW